MIPIRRYLRKISLCLFPFVLLQSCVAYHKADYAPAEAANAEKGRIKVQTKNGMVYKFQWIETDGDNIYSIRNMEQMVMRKSEVKDFLVGNPLQVVDLETALAEDGAVCVKMKKSKNEEVLVDYTFVRIRENGDLINAYRMINRDTVRTVIPISDIDRLQVQNMKKSTTGNILLFIGGAWLVLAVILAIQMTQDDFFTISLGS